MCVVTGLWCPSHSAMTDVSTPALSKAIAAVCRSVCGVTFFAAIEGQMVAAVAACLATSR